MIFDVILTAGSLYDGTGDAPRTADIAINGDTIKAIGSLVSLGAEAEKIIDCRGKAVAPGFIDMHSHADLSLLWERQSLPKVMQGVTTEVIGNCGLAPVPARADDVEALRSYLGGVMGDFPVAFRGLTVHEYLSALENQGTGVNVVPLVAHGALRRKTGFNDCSTITDEAQRAMERDLEEALDRGAFGLSTGLAYPPAYFADTEELVRLTRIVRNHDGLFSIHLRSEGTFVEEALEEALFIAEKSGVRLEISHFKAYGEKNWHKTESLLSRLEKAEQSGIPAAFDAYPYIFGSTTLSALLPPSLITDISSLGEALKDKAFKKRIIEEICIEPPGKENYVALLGWGHLVFSGGASGKNDGFNGLSLEEIALRKDMTPEEALLSILCDEGGSASMLTMGMCEESVQAMLSHRLHCLGSDGLYGTRPHPRTYGSFVRLLERYTREIPLFTLSEAISHMTSRTAERLGLARRGKIKEGFLADIVIFDCETVHEGATLDDPKRYPTGIDYVMVNGALAIDRGKPTEALPGRVLRNTK